MSGDEEDELGDVYSADEEDESESDDDNYGG